MIGIHVWMLASSLALVTVIALLAIQRRDRAERERDFLVTERLRLNRKIKDLQDSALIHQVAYRAMQQEIQRLQSPPPPPTHGLLQYPRKDP